MKLKSKITTVAVLSLLMIGSAVAEGGKGSGNCKKNNALCSQKGEHQGHKLREKLNLSDKQFAKLNELKKAHREGMKEQREKIKTLRTEMLNEIKKETPNSSTTDRLADDIGKVHAEITKKMNRHLIEIKAVLSAEQFDKLIEMKQRQRKHHKGKKGGKKAK